MNVTPEDRLQLEAIVSDGNAPQKHVWRAKIILGTADGCGTSEIMRPSGKAKAVAGALQAFCIETLEDALARYGKPEIFNTDQGSQFTGQTFTGALAGNGVAISMDGKGAWRDNVFVERLWRSVKYEEVYLRAYDSVSEARASIGRYFDFYNGRRPHASLDGNTPDQAYFNPLPIRMAA